MIQHRIAGAAGVDAAGDPLDLALQLREPRVDLAQLRPDVVDRLGGGGPEDPRLVGQLAELITLSRLRDQAQYLLEPEEDVVKRPVGGREDA